MNKNITYFVMDVDGTLTDGKIYMGELGELMKAFNVKDGYAINELMKKTSIEPVIITGRRSEIVRNRAMELGITHIYQGIKDKIKTLLNITKDIGNVAVIGDDLNDIEMMRAVKNAGGLVGCPKDAAEEIKEIADYVASNNGGDGAVRDFVEWIIN